MNIIRKISVGPDQLNAMHYQVGNKMMGKSHEVTVIREIEPGVFDVWINNLDSNETYLWKTVRNMPVVVEYSIDFE